MRTALRRLALLLYSLGPGLAKLSGIDAMFGVGLLMLMLYFAMLASPADEGGLAQWRVRALLLSFVAYALALAGLLWLADMLLEWTTVVGIGSFLVPLACVVIAGPERSARLLDDVPAVAVVHAVIALSIYAPLRPDIGWLQSAGDTLLEGALAFRLASVSGSLALSSIMVVAFAVTLRQHFDRSRRSVGSWLAGFGACLFVLCTFLTLQRAAWIALGLIVAVAAFKAPPGRRAGLGAMVALAVAPLFVGAVLIDLPADALEVVIERFDTLRGEGDIGAVAERSDQWLNVIHNLARLPLGFGPGQLGQAVRDAQPHQGGLPIYDGDYFRIASEYGLMGAALTALVIASLLAALRNLLGTLRGRRALSDGLLSAAAIGLMLQGIGTNVTELYFANTLFWALLLQQWRVNLPCRDRAARMATPAVCP